MGSAIASDQMTKSVDFLKNYKKNYGKDMEAGHGPAPSYESVYILAEAIERAGSIDPDALVAEIKKTDRMGVMGRIKFDDGQQAVFGLDPKRQPWGWFFSGPKRENARLSFRKPWPMPRSSFPGAEVGQIVSIPINGIFRLMPAFSLFAILA